MGTVDSRTARLLRSKLAWCALGVGAAVFAVGLALFQPWKLWVDKTVVEALPMVAAPVVATPSPSSPTGAPVTEPAPPAVEPVAVTSTGATVPRPRVDRTPNAPTLEPMTPKTATPKPATPAPARATEPVVEYRGTLISHEHGTSGTVRILRLADGSRVLRLDNLDTSNGPDLKVMLSDAEVLPGRDGWHVFDDGDHRKLGKLKGNKGSQNYPIPADVDPADFRSMTIWCDRFNVSFGAAELRPVG